MSQNDTFKKIESALFLPDHEAAQQLTPYQNERRRRWMFCVSKRMDNPMIPDRELVRLLMAGMTGQFEPVVQSTAYRDVAAVNRAVGNMQLAGKNWYRYMIIEGAKEAYDLAKSREDAKGMSSALNIIGKYTMADKPDNDFDWEQMIPINIEPSADADLLENIEPIEDIDQRRQELRDLFKTTMNRQATDAEFTEE